MEATAKDLRFYSKKLLEAVSRGEEVVITYRGKPQAKLVPFSNKTSMESKHRLFGIWRDNEAVNQVNDTIRKIRKGRIQNAL